MARTRAAENPRFLPKSISLDDIETGTGRLQEILTAINDFSRDGFPYRDAARTKAESQLRECVKQIFGEHSQEFHTYRNYKLRTSSKAETAQSIAAVKGLMQNLENKKLELQGVTPPAIIASESGKINSATTAQIRLVPPTTQAAVTPQSVGAVTPMTVSAAITANLGTPAAPTAAIARPSHPKPQMPQTPAVSITQEMPHRTPVQPATAPTPVPVGVTPPTQAASVTQEILRAPVQPTTAPTPAPTSVPSAPAVSVTQEIHRTPVHPAAAPAPVSMPPAPTVSVTQEIQRTPVQPTTAPTPAPSAPAQPMTASDTLDIPSFQPLSEQQTLALLRKVCLRLHSVARQLRLRKDSRPTVEVEDDYDLQDLLRALLKMEFDEVGTDEWTPPYAGSIPRTTLLLNREQIAIVAKKTRTGLTAKDIAEQVATDSAFYSARNKCTTLFCFVYDPEGRIGSPKRLETDLTSVNNRYTVEVLVAPK